MRSFVLIAAVPLLALTGCGLPGTGDKNSSAATNASAPIPDTVEVNGITYVRADAGKPAPAATPPAAPSSNSLPPPISDSGSSVPPNTGSGGTAADHGE